MRATVAVLRRYARASGGLARKGPGPLHAKFGNRKYYKGSQTRTLGRRTRKGGFVVDWKERVPEYVTPGMVPFGPRLPPSLAIGAPGWDHGLRPYVSAHTPKITIPPPFSPTTS